VAPAEPSDLADTTVLEEVAVTDGHESDEEPRIFLEEEVQSSDEEDDDSDEDEERLARSRRPRGCLAGCECEKKRGRRCNCERTRDGVCDEACACDKSNCRTQIDGEEEESNEGNEMNS